MSDAARPVESSITTDETVNNVVESEKAPKTPGRIRRAFDKLRETFAADPPLREDQVTKARLINYVVDRLQLATPSQTKQGIFFDANLYSDFAGYHNTANVNPRVESKIQNLMHELANDGLAQRQQIVDGRTGGVRMGWVFTTDTNALKSALKSPAI